MKVLVTGGAGFIGSHLVQALLKKNFRVCNIDKMTYASDGNFIAEQRKNPLFSHHQICLTKRAEVTDIALEFNPDFIFHLAAESHVDRSIENPDPFIESNIIGTVTMLEVCRKLFQKNKNVKMVHVSTDEVYGSLELNSNPFTTQSAYKPNSPYSASKASSDHFARAWWVTYGCPVVITHCSNNYGPRQYSEKLIPVVVNSLKNRKAIPIYGQGINIRDWIHVYDHVRGLMLLLEKFTPGAVYNFGGDNEVTNIDLVHKIIAIYDRLQTSSSDSRGLIEFVSDRLGHDLRYAIDAQQTEQQLGWKAEQNFDQGLEETVRYYLGRPQ